jgi:drug/metabolite transporter, DME family
MTAAGASASTIADERRGYLIVLAAAMMWATSGVFISYLTRTAGVAPLWVSFWRDGLAALLLAGGLAVLRPALLRVSRQDLVFLTTFAVLGLAWVEVVWTYSVAYNGASIATVLAYTAPAFVALFSWKLFDEPIGWRMIAAIAVVIVGCALVAQVIGGGAVRWNPGEIAVGLLGGIGFAVYGLFGKAAARRGINPWTTTVYICGLAALVLLALGVALAWVGRGPARPVWAVSDDPQAWLCLALLAIIPTLMGDGLYMMGMAYMRVSMASLICSLEPVFTAGAAFVALGERLSLLQVTGSLIIVAAIIALQISNQRTAVSDQQSAVSHETQADEGAPLVVTVER